MSAEGNILYIKATVYAAPVAHWTPTPAAKHSNCLHHICFTESRPQDLPCLPRHAKLGPTTRHCHASLLYNFLTHYMPLWCDYYRTCSQYTCFQQILLSIYKLLSCVFQVSHTPVFYSPPTPSHDDATEVYSPLCGGKVARIQRTLGHK